MKVIIIEDTVYKVSEKEYRKLRKMADDIKVARWPESDELNDKINDYLDESKPVYTEIGPVCFDYRR